LSDCLEVTAEGERLHRKYVGDAENDSTQRDVVESWLKAAIVAGTFSEAHTGSFPRYVWHKVAEQCFEARLTNQAIGAYKGYPIGAEESPL
jgi:hypothetical protein